MAVGRSTNRSRKGRSPRRSNRERVPAQEAGDLLALEALDQTGSVAVWRTRAKAACTHCFASSG